MFDDFKIANYSKALLSPELFARHFSRFLSGDVIDGLTVTPGTGLQVVLAPGNALLRYGSSAVASARLVSLVNNFNLSIDTADASNPRIDLVVVYVDNAVSLPGGTPTSANLDGPGVAKAKIVKGTAASSPSAPNSTAIQSSVGSGNPYTVVAQVRVNAGVTVIASDKITDVRSLAKLTAQKLDLATFEFAETNVDLSNKTITTSESTIGSLTIPATGVYTVDAGIRVNGQAYLISFFRVNGAASYSFSQMVNSSSAGFMSTGPASLSKFFNAGDVIEFRVQGSASATTQTSRPDANFIRAIRFV